MIIKTFSKIIISFALALSGISLASSFSSTTVTAQEEKKYDPNLTITYPYLTSIFKDSVLATGRSDRARASKLKAEVGTRINRGNNKITRLEGNRVMFNKFGKKNKKMLADVKADLSTVPAQVPLSEFHPNEQLAYWLNIRNLAVFEEVARTYPKKLLKRTMQKFNKKDSLKIAGKKMSVNDVEELVIKQFKNPIVIYGFFTGAIGGPNLRTTPFTADTVWNQLESNGKDFVNSLRGVQFNVDTLKVSTFYKKHRAAFPNFETDLRNHLMSLAGPLMLPPLNNATTIKVNVEDWYTVDLYAGGVGLGSAGAINPAALLSNAGSAGNEGSDYKDPETKMAGVYSDAGGGLGHDSSHGINAQTSSIIDSQTASILPKQVLDYLKEISLRNRRMARNKGTVTIDEVENKEKKKK